MCSRTYYYYRRPNGDGFVIISLIGKFLSVSRIAGPTVPCVLKVRWSDGSFVSGAVRMRSRTVYKLTHATCLSFVQQTWKKTVHVYAEFPREKQRSSRSSKVSTQFSSPVQIYSRFGIFSCTYIFSIFMMTCTWIFIRS